MVRDGTVNGVVKYRSYCNECRARQRREKNQGQDMPWQERLGKIQARAKKRGIKCTITAADLESLWDAQRGRCAYTREGMLIGYGFRNHPRVVSVDRVDPSLGYEPDNIVLCTARANSIKQDMTMLELMIWMPLWYLRLRKLRRRNGTL